MSSTNRKDPQQIDPQYVARLREAVEQARQTLRNNHLKTEGLRLAHLLAYNIEQILVDHVQETASRLGVEHMADEVALIAVGGFGRLELELYSDIDFVFVTEREPTEEEEEFIKAVIRPLFDLRLDLGYGVHPVKDVLGFLGSDVSKVTALLAMRHVWGNEPLTEELQERLHVRLEKKFKKWFVDSLEEEIRERHTGHGDTVFLLEPDVKLSPGTLRDIHQILWIAFAFYGKLSLEVLVENRILYGPGKAANAGGVAVSGLEMAQNDQRMSWTREQVDEQLHNIMIDIHENCRQTAEEFGTPGNYVNGANIAGFLKVADVMLDQGLI